MLLPLDAKKSRFGEYSDQPVVNGKPLKINSVDAQNAFSSATCVLTFTQTKRVRGSRGAGAVWEDTYRMVIESACAQGYILLVCFIIRKWTCVIHGNDSVTLGYGNKLNRTPPFSE